MSSATAAIVDAGRRSPAMLGFAAARLTPAQARVHAVDLEHHRSALTRYARRCLCNVADADDAVQDTLTAALASTDFAGRSSPSTWLPGILKHKIVDVYRRQAREPVREAPPEDELLDETDASFTADGHWRDAPTPWGDPETALARREFHDVLEGCIACLPTNCARAFKLRELMGLEVGEICEVLGISADNCYVMLHRARMKLRVLLEKRWFALPR